jgi:hypothetical protein
VFDAEMERRRVTATTENDSSDISWFSEDPDAPTLENKATEQRALVDSLETLKKTEDAANETLQRCLLEDAATHRASSARAAGGGEVVEGETQRQGQAVGQQVV